MEQLIIDYKNRMFVKDIQVKYSLSYSKVTKILKEAGVYKKHGSLHLKEGSSDFIKTNYYKMSNKDIAKYLNISDDTVRLTAKKLGLEKKGSGWKEHTLLKNIGADLQSKEFRYFLGWIAADGNVNKKGYGTSLSITDEIVVDNFLSIFPHAKKYHTEKLTKDMYQLSIGSKEFNTYMRGLGFTPNKTYTLKVKDSLFTPEFVRGFFEGDGHVRKTTAKSKYTRYEAGFVCASKDFIIQLQNYLAINSIKTTLYQEKTYYRLRITSRETLKAFYNLIYTNCGKWYLPRKKQILDQLFSDE